MGVKNFHWKCDIVTCAVLSALEPDFSSHGGLVSLLVNVVVVVIVVVVVCS